MTQISNIGNATAVGAVTGTGAAIPVLLGFTPSVIQVINTTHEVVLWYDSAMPAGYGYKTIGTGAGTISSTTATGTNGTSAVTGTGTFTGTAPTAALNIATPVFSGTGQSSAGQVITTTDNQTMTLNQCAGMWFVSATHGPYLIASNTAVTGAPAVLTIVGTAPTTDAGAYQILKALTPVGTVSALSGTAAAQTFTGASHTHTFTGSAADNAYITTGGITLNANGFTIGTDADLNQNGDNLIIVAWRK